MPIYGGMFPDLGLDTFILDSQYKREHGDTQKLLLDDLDNRYRAGSALGTIGQAFGMLTNQPNIAAASKMLADQQRAKYFDERSQLVINNAAARAEELRKEREAEQLRKERGEASRWAAGQAEEYFKNPFVQWSDPNYMGPPMPLPMAKQQFLEGLQKGAMGEAPMPSSPTSDYEAEANWRQKQRFEEMAKAHQYDMAEIGARESRYGGRQDQLNETEFIRTIKDKTTPRRGTDDEGNPVTVQPDPIEAMLFIDTVLSESGKSMTAGAVGIAKAEFARLYRSLNPQQKMYIDQIFSEGGPGPMGPPKPIEEALATGQQQAAPQSGPSMDSFDPMPQIIDALRGAAASRDIENKRRTMSHQRPSDNPYGL